MQTETSVNNPKRLVPFPQQQVAYNVRRFASLFGKERTWGYRMVYSGKVKVLPPEVTQSGEFLIPHSEVERLLSGAVPYSDEIAGKAVQRKKQGATSSRKARR